MKNALKDVWIPSLGVYVKGLALVSELSEAIANLEKEAHECADEYVKSAYVGGEPVYEEIVWASGAKQQMAFNLDTAVVAELNLRVTRAFEEVRNAAQRLVDAEEKPLTRPLDQKDRVALMMEGTQLPEYDDKDAPERDTLPDKVIEALREGMKKNDGLLRRLANTKEESHG